MQEPWTLGTEGRDVHRPMWRPGVLIFAFWGGLFPAQAAEPTPTYAKVFDAKSDSSAGNGFKLPATQYQNYVALVNADSVDGAKIGSADADTLSGDKCPPLPNAQGSLRACVKFTPVTGKQTQIVLEYTAAGQKKSKTLNINEDRGGGGAGGPGVAFDDTAVRKKAMKDALARAHLKVDHPDDPDLVNVYDGDTAILFFDLEGKPLYTPQPLVDEDDTIYVVVIGTEDKKVKGLDVTKCSAAKVFRVGGGLPTNLTLRDLQEEGGTDYAIAVGAKCSADDGLEVKVTASDKSQSTISIKTLPLYHLTVGLGLLYDWTPQTTFTVAQVKGETAGVIAQDTHYSGLSAVAFVTFHVWATDTVRNRLDEFRVDFGRFVAEHVGVALGISLNAPLEHFYVALNIEPYPGFGVLVGYHQLQVPTLAGGYSVGDRFSGVTVPVDKRWANFDLKDYPHVFVGLSVDAAVLGDLLHALNR